MYSFIEDEAQKAAAVARAAGYENTAKALMEIATAAKAEVVRDKYLQSQPMNRNENFGQYCKKSTKSGNC